MTEKQDPLTYAGAGVSIATQDDFLERIKPICRQTHDKFVIGGIGPFAPAVDISGLAKSMSIDINEVVMLQSTDGPGTIPILAQMAHEAAIHTIDDDWFASLGYNVAAHCGSDVACAGGRPITMLDSISWVGGNIDSMVQIVKGMAEACLEMNCRLIGGETAQLPGILADGRLSFDGFITALADRRDLIEPEKTIRPGNVILGIFVDFPCLNGISLVRKIVFDILRMAITDILPPTGRTVAAEFLRRQPNYGRIVARQIATGLHICGNANITGGGLYDNIARILPDDCRAMINSNSWPIPPLYKWLIEQGNIDIAEAFKVWSMGIGFVQIFSQMADALDVQRWIKDRFGLNSAIIGEVIAGEKGVEIAYP